MREGHRAEPFQKPNIEGAATISRYNRARQPSDERGRERGCASQGQGIPVIREKGMGMARIELHPADADRARVLEQFKKDQDFVDSHYEEWSAAYPDHWVVVYQGRLVGAVRTIGDVTRLAVQESIPPMRVVSRYLRSEPVTLIL